MLKKVCLAALLVFAYTNVAFEKAGDSVFSRFYKYNFRRLTHLGKKIFKHTSVSFSTPSVFFLIFEFLVVKYKDSASRFRQDLVHILAGLHRPLRAGHSHLCRQDNVSRDHFSRFIIKTIISGSLLV